MYEDFFGFSRRPFSLTPDPEFLYWTDQHRNAFDLVCMSLLRQAPIALITGEVGAGKTTLLQALLHEISSDFEVGLLSNVSGDSGDLLRWILTAFGYEAEPATRAEALRQVEALLAGVREEGRRSVLVIDEAQNVTDHGIETLRLLTNMDVGKSAPLSLIVAGQPELRDRLAAPAFRAFRQRLGASYHLGPMTLEETAGYIRNRTVVAGGEADVMDDGAIEAVYRRAEGVPRLTNLLCDLCFVAAFGEDRSRIDADFAEAALADSLALGGLGGLPAQAAEPEAEAKVAARQAVPARRMRLVPSAPAEARAAAAQQDRPENEEPPLLLTRRVPDEPGAADAAEDDESAAKPSRGRGGEALRRAMGSVAGLAVAASVAGLALILPATGTDGSQATEAGADAPLTLAAARSFHTAASPGGVAAAGVAAAGEAGASEARLAPPDPEGAERLFERALDKPDPAAAAIDYSRAAARGHHRAAYYLAQMYETGDGVPYAPDTAWNWYAASADQIRGAEERLGQLAAFATTDAAFATPVFSAADGSVIELVWRGRGSFVVELASAPDAADPLVHATALTAALLEVPEDIAWWRVRAIGAEPSEWRRLGTSAAY